MADSSLDAVIAEIIAQWRTDNPTARQIPRAVRKELSRAVREDAQNQRMDTEIARSQIGLEILHHQRAMVTGSRRAPGQSETDWAAAQQRLAARGEALERRIHSFPGLNVEDRGSAVAALRRAHNAEASAPPQQVQWAPAAGKPSLSARVVARLSAIRLGIVVATHGLQSPLFVAAQAEAARRAESPQQATGDWLTPAQAAAVQELTTVATRFEQTAALARGGESAYLSKVVADFGAALDHARQLGVPSERLDSELAAVHRQAEAPSAATALFGRWGSKTRAAAGPMTPPTTSAAPQRAPAATGPVAATAAVAGQSHVPGRAR
ncbi:hypothetical protein [Nocardia camponoti]|uniref:Uncharacterized protein n=1 Tax=Nocardia camponoti TaxID=1616106 RepID=A0A917VEF0_9NOCA|nr:hypothetical protein [Nocardia camponoti]GGK68931.1 hypothetical protein GCM10011591_46310 [Nocardia camponoti]